MPHFEMGYTDPLKTQLNKLEAVVAKLATVFYQGGEEPAQLSDNSEVSRLQRELADLSLQLAAVKGEAKKWKELYEARQTDNDRLIRALDEIRDLAYDATDNE